MICRHHKTTKFTHQVDYVCVSHDEFMSEFYADEENFTFIKRKNNLSSKITQTADEVSDRSGEKKVMACFFESSSDQKTTLITSTKLPFFSMVFMR